MNKTIEEINEKIKKGTAVVLTAEEIIDFAKDNGIEKAAKEVDVVTTATFGPMCSSGIFLNFGHANPPIKMKRVWLNDVPAYTGIAAVDAYIGATELSDLGDFEYGGAHVIEDLIDGKDIKLYAESYGTDCYPRKEITTTINKSNINQAYMFNPRNAYQNYPAATNSSDRTIYTYMGTLLPNNNNINYSTSGQLSPLINDPYLRTVGIGTRIFLGGTVGYVSWEGSQHNPNPNRGDNGVPIGPGASLALIGDIKHMSKEFVRAAVYEGYGVSLFVGIGIPIPIIDKDILINTLVSDDKIFTEIIDKSGNEGSLRKVSYKELRSGLVELKGKKVQSAPLSSLRKAREIANLLKNNIKNSNFYLTQAVQPLPRENVINKLDLRGEYRV
ncbi:MAG: homocysteine biosynthesis protein [Clostridiales bacterium]